ncbi:hypothetical protein Tco_0586983 [Tanacetum coccineum]
MGSAIVKLVKKVKKLEGILKRKNVVFSDSEEEESEDQGRKSQDDPLVSLVQGLVTPSKTTVNASGEEQVEDISPNTFEAAKTLSRVASQKPKSIDKGRRRKEASLAEAIRLDTLEKEEEAKQVHLDSLLAQRIAEEEEVNKQQKKRRAQVQFEAQHYTDEDWDLIRAKIEANAELSKSMLGTDLQGEDFAKKMVDLGTWKLSQLKKNLSFKEVKEEFDKLVKQTSKRLKSDEAKDDEPTKKTGKRRKQMARIRINTDLDKDILKIPNEATLNKMFLLFREDGTNIVYINFGAMLKDITRDDLTELYRIVMNRYGVNGPEDELKKVLWGYLKNIVHCLNLESMDIYMLIERQYPLSAEVCKAMLDKKLQGGKLDEDYYKLLKWMEKQAGIKK